MPERFLQIALLSLAADAHRSAAAGAHNPQRCSPPANEKFRTKWHLLMNTASPTASSDVSMPTNFNPRSPRGERPQKIMQIFHKSIFETNTFVNFCASSEKTTPYRMMKAPCRPEFEVRTCKGTFVCFHSAQVLSLRHTTQSISILRHRPYSSSRQAHLPLPSGAHSDHPTAQRAASDAPWRKNTGRSGSCAPTK